MLEGGSVAIIGGGIVGLATAYRLWSGIPGARSRFSKKKTRWGGTRRGHNSGVLHCGLYYKPGSVKARMAVEGIRQMVAFCAENGIAHEICGKLVVAADENEVAAAEESARARNGERARRAALAGPRGDARDRAARGRRGGAARAAGRHRGLPAVCAALARKIEERGGARGDSARGCTRLRAPRGGLGRRDHSWRFRSGVHHQLRGIAVRPRGGDGRRAARHAHPAVSRRILPDQARAAISGAQPDLSGARPAAFRFWACISRG